MKNLIRLFSFLLLSVYLTSCDSDENEVIPLGPTIFEIASDTENLSTLVQALEITGLDQVLNSPGSFTVLAPTNDDFTQFLVSAGFNSLEEIPTDLLTNVLLNHVIAGELTSGLLSNGYANTLAVSDASSTSLSIYINTDNGVTFNGVSSVATADVNASNGVVHIVNGVIGLPTVVTFALADPNFSTLVQALTREDLTTDFVTLLATPSSSSPSPFTVFAPLNSAFENLLSELQLSSLNDLDEPTLSAVLFYHVVAETNQPSSTLSGGMVFSTVLDSGAPGQGELLFNYTDSGSGTLTDNNGRVTNIVAVDVQANNGIIHAIDTVLLP